MELLIMLSSATYHFLPLASKYSLQDRVLKLSLCSFLNVRYEVAQPFKTTGEIIVLYILIVTFLDV